MTTPEFGSKLAQLEKDLYSFTHRFTRDREESADLVQDTFLKALKYRNQFKQDYNLKGWLFTIMRNTFINHYRKKKRSGYFSQTFSFQSIGYPNSQLPETHLEYQDLVRPVHNLRKELQIPFQMHCDGYSYQEIADQLGIPLGTVKNRIFQARKEMQGKLKGYW